MNSTLSHELEEPEQFKDGAGTFTIREGLLAMGDATNDSGKCGA